MLFILKQDTKIYLFFKTIIRFQSQLYNFPQSNLHFYKNNYSLILPHQSFIRYF